MVIMTVEMEAMKRTVVPEPALLHNSYVQIINVYTDDGLVTETMTVEIGVTRKTVVRIVLVFSCLRTFEPIAISRTVLRKFIQI